MRGRAEAIRVVERRGQNRGGGGGGGKHTHKALMGLTVLTLLLAYAGHGLRRSAGWLIIAAYIAFVLTLLAVS